MDKKENKDKEASKRKLDAFSSLANQIQGLSVSLHSKDTEISQLTNTILEKDNNLIKLKTRIDELLSQNGKLREKINDKTESLVNDKLKKELENINKEISVLQEENSSLKKENSNYINQIIQLNNKQLENIKNENKNLDEKIIKEKQEEKEEKLEKVCSKYEEVEIVKKIYSNKIEKLKEKITFQESEIKKLKEKNEQLSMQITDKIIQIEKDKEKLTISNNKHIILTEKFYKNNLHWYLLSEKNINEKGLDYTNCFWVKESDISNEIEEFETKIAKSVEQETNEKILQAQIIEKDEEIKTLTEENKKMQSEKNILLERCIPFEKYEKALNEINKVNQKLERLRNFTENEMNKKNNNKSIYIEKEQNHMQNDNEKSNNYAINENLNKNKEKIKIILQNILKEIKNPSKIKQTIIELCNIIGISNEESESIISTKKK